MMTRSTLLAIISELALWTTLLLLLFAGSIILPSLSQKSKLNRNHVVTLHFKDANQLTTGSPVNLMGTTIGYVTRVKATDDHVKVTFQTDSNQIALPEGTRFTVEFNSLAGAKTLEALPPQAEASLGEKKYIEEEPIRLRDVLRTQMVLAQALESNSENLAETLGQIQGQDNLLRKLQMIDQRFLEAHRIMVYALESLRYQTLRIHNTVEDATHSVAAFNKTARQLEYAISPAFFKTNAMATMRFVSLAVEDIYRSFLNIQNRQYLDTAQAGLDAIRHKTQSLYQSSESNLPRFLDLMERGNKALAKMGDFLYRTNTAWIPGKLQERIGQYRQYTESWAIRTGSWLKKPKND